MEKYQTALWTVYGVGVVLVPIIMGFIVKPEDCKAAFWGAFWGEGVIATLVLALVWPVFAIVVLVPCVFIIAAILIGGPIYCLVAGLMCVGIYFRSKGEHNKKGQK